MYMMPSLFVSSSGVYCTCSKISSAAMVDASFHFGIMQHEIEESNAEQLTNDMKQLRYAATTWCTEAAAAYMSRVFGGLLIAVMHAELLHIV